MASRSRKGPVWARHSDEALLDLRFCDLGVRVNSTPMATSLDRLYGELEERGLRFRPHAWYSSEWFSPDGVPGIAVPFYLAHPRLTRLEKNMMYEVEGGTPRQCMQILRHEAGHAYSTAYRLHFKRAWQKVFGRAGQRYPTYYRPKPFSRDYVLHLDWWYAQAHPSEDFAETFAVWLQPRSKWRRQYAGWPALKKIEFVDELMQGVVGRAPVIKTRRKADPLSQLRSTLRQHYRRKQGKYADESADFYTRDLRRLFPPTADGAPSAETAANFIRRASREIRQAVSEWTGAHPYSIDKVLRDMTLRCRDLKLRRTLEEQHTKTNAMLMVAVQTMNYLSDGRLRIAL